LLLSQNDLFKANIESSDMKSLFILLIFLTSCSGIKTQENFNSEANKDSTLNQAKDDANTSKNPAADEDWAVTMNATYMRTARISRMGATPDGEVFTAFELQCPSKENSVTSFTYQVWNPSQIPSFNFSYFEGPDAPALKVKLMKIEAYSPDKRVSWQFKPAGLYGGYAEELAFEFSPSTFNKPDKTAELAQMIAKGSTEVTITVQDNRDKEKIIKSTFPPINPLSDVAKILNGCRN
jgi:hypothetical protein